MTVPALLDQADAVLIADAEDLLNHLNLEKFYPDNENNPAI